MIRLLITSGRGPTECRIAVAKALEVLSREAVASGLDIDCLEGQNSDGHGPASAIAVIHGEGAAACAREWTGSIQWISQSPVRPHHKRKNWFIGIFALPSEPVLPGKIALSDVRFEAFRAGGPGGQHQNKTESAVRAVHVPSGLAVVARDERSQHRNKSLALERLSNLIKLGHELSAITQRQKVQASHDLIERGRPVKRFKGEGFRED